MVRVSLHDVHGLRPREPCELGRSEPDEVVLRARSGPDNRVAEQKAIEVDRLHLGQGKGCDGPGCETGRALHLVRLRDASIRRADCLGNLARISPPVSGDERDDGPPVADEDE